MLISYTKTNVNVITTVIAIIIFCFLNYVGTNINNMYSNIKESINAEQIIETKELSEKSKVETKELNEKGNTETKEKITNNTQKQTDAVWQIEIPKIKLIAPISSRNNKRSNGQVCWAF